MSTESDIVKLNIEEVINLGAEDGVFFSQFFFPKTCRQPPSKIHSQVWQMLDSTDATFVALEMFRGSAKTSILRMFAARRIAYQISRTIVFCSVTQDHAKRSLRWIKRQILYNQKFTQTFNLQKGDKWTDEEMNIIISVPDSEPIIVTILAIGITGQIRGVNLEDYRPDLIVVDDPCNEENTNTEEQRLKTSRLFFGGLQPGLAPKSECKHAKMVLLQTGLAKGDIIEQCHNNTLWRTLKFSCFDESGQSCWPERYTTEELNQLKKSYIENGQIDVWMREYECKHISAATRAFIFENLNYYDILPEGITTTMAIDPASSLSPTASYSAIVVVGFHSYNVYCCDYWQGRTDNPEELASEFFRLCFQWKPAICAVETIAYQKVLATFLKQKMHQMNYFVPIKEVQDRREKWNRIRQTLTARIANRMLYVKANMTDLITQIHDAPSVQYPDLLDAMAMAVGARFEGATSETNIVPFARLLAEEKRKYGKLPNTWRVA